MAHIGYHTSKEQHAPSALPGYVRAVEAAGSACALPAERFRPRSPAQGHSSRTWSWLGTATTNLPCSTIVPGWSRHPAVLPRLWMSDDFGRHAARLAARGREISVQQVAGGRGAFADALEQPVPPQVH